MAIVIDLTTVLPATRSADGVIKGPPISDRVEGVVVHHEGGSANGSSPWGIANYHVNTEGWSHIGYHYVIHLGKVYRTLPVTYAGYHAGYVENIGDDISKFPNMERQYYNDHYLAICLVGNYSIVVPKKEDMAALSDFIAQLKGKQSEFRVLGHRELPGKATTCPGSLFNMDKVRSDVDKLLGTGIAPTEGDDNWAKEFMTWKDAAVGIKGSHDFLMGELGRIEIELLSDREELRVLGNRLRDRALKIGTLLRPGPTK